jgi:hypothetical protein
MKTVSAGELRPLVGDLRQLASVRAMVLDEGSERGVRALAFSTGGGLDFWVLSDRSFDIGPLWYRGLPVGWQAPGGFRHPALGHVEHDGGTGINRLLSGLLTTCGLDHVRQARPGHPQHGRLPLTPARLLSSGEDWQAATPVLQAEAEVVQSRLGGECLRLHRRITAPIGGCEIRLTDTVTNDADHPQPHDILYHFNLGYPSIDTGSMVEMNGTQLFGPLRLADPAGTGDAHCHPVRDASICRVTVRTPLANGASLCIDLEFGTTTLPYLQLWRDLRPRCGLLAIEPCASRRIDGGGSADVPLLAPGESRHYDITLRFRETTP